MTIETQVLLFLAIPLLYLLYVVLPPEDTCKIALWRNEQLVSPRLNYCLLSQENIPFDVANDVCLKVIFSA